MNPWIKVTDRLPENNQMCLLYGEASNSVLGPVIYKVDEKVGKGMWIDLFATPEAGAAYSPEDGVTHWQPWVAPDA